MTAATRWLGFTPVAPPDIGPAFSFPKIFALEITTGDFALAASHRLRALPEARRFRISLRFRCTAMLAGLRTLIQTGHGPDR
jgi:hypothetical protein